MNHKNVNNGGIEDRVSSSLTPLKKFITVLTAAAVIGGATASIYPLGRHNGFEDGVRTAENRINSCYKHGYCEPQPWIGSDLENSRRGAVYEACVNGELPDDFMQYYLSLRVAKEISDRCNS